MSFKPNFIRLQQSQTQIGRRAVKALQITEYAVHNTKSFHFCVRHHTSNLQLSTFSHGICTSMKNGAKLCQQSIFLFFRYVNFATLIRAIAIRKASDFHWNFHRAPRIQ